MENTIDQITGVELKFQLSEQWGWTDRMGFLFKDLADTKMYKINEMVEGICTSCGANTRMSPARMLKLKETSDSHCITCHGSGDVDNIEGSIVPKDINNIITDENFVGEESLDEDEKLSDEISMESFGKSNDKTEQSLEKLSSGTTDNVIATEEVIEEYDSYEDAVQSYIDDATTELSYRPYYQNDIVLNDNDEIETIKLECTSCKQEVSFEDYEDILKTKVLVGDNTVHDCPHCKFSSRGQNINLSQRISILRKELHLKDLPFGDQFRNEYAHAQDIYRFQDANGKLQEFSEKDMETQISTNKNAEKNVVEKAEEPEPVEETVIEEKNTITEESAVVPFETDEDVNEVHEEVKTEMPEMESDNVLIEPTSTEEIIEESPVVEETFSKEDYEIMPDDEDGIIEETDPEIATKAEKIMNYRTVEPQSIVDRDEKIRKDNMANTVTEDEAEIIEEPIVYDNVNVLSTEELIEKIDNRNTHDNADVDRSNIRYSKEDNEQFSTNKQFEETRIFNKPEIFTVCPFEDEDLLKEDFIETDFYRVIKKATDKVRTEFHKRPKMKIIINEKTMEFPIVDIEGGVRIACVDLASKNSGQITMDRVSNGIPYSFGSYNPSEIALYVIYSDMVQNDHVRKATAKTLSKIIDFRLGFNSQFNVIELGKYDAMAYTTDKDQIRQFELQNSPSPRAKATTDAMGIIVRWDNRQEDYNAQQRRMMNAYNRKHRLDYKDMSMYMACSVRYITVPVKNLVPGQRPRTDIIIAEYTELANSYIMDGFGYLVGAITRNILAKNPNTTIAIYYERDKASIPSPTVQRYIVNNKVKEVIEDKSLAVLNQFAKNGNLARIPSDNPAFENPEYNKHYWPSYVKSSEFQTGSEDSIRKDWRFFTPSSLVRWLGKELSEAGVDPRNNQARMRFIAKMGYHIVTQLPIVKYKLEGDFVKDTYNATIQKNMMEYSIAQVTRSLGGNVIDDDYLSRPGYNNQQQMNYFGMNPYGMNPQMMGMHTPNQFGGRQ